MNNKTSISNLTVTFFITAVSSHKVFVANFKLIQKDNFLLLLLTPIDYFTVVCSVTWPLDGSEAGVALVLIHTSLLLSCKTSCSDAN